MAVRGWDGTSTLQRHVAAQVSRRLLEEAAAELWMLAPPCQPYTRRGLQQDAADSRARSFLKILDWIPTMKARRS